MSKRFQITTEHNVRDFQEVELQASTITLQAQEIDGKERPFGGIYECSVHVIRVHNSRTDHRQIDVTIPAPGGVFNRKDYTLDMNFRSSPATGTMKETWG